MIKNKLFASIFVCGLMLMWTAPSQAKELKVGLGDLDYPPYYFVKDGRLHGAAIEIARHLATKLGHTFVFERYPWRRVQFYLQTGEIDMVILYFKTPERAKDVEYTDTPHISESSYLCVAKGTEIPYKGNLDGLQAYRFGNVRGYSHGTEYNNAKHIAKYEITNEKNLIKMLIRGRIDIAIGNKAVINMYAEQEGSQDKITFLMPPIDKAPNFFAFSKVQKDALELAQEFSSEVKKIINTETYRYILKKYGFDMPG